MSADLYKIYISNLLNQIENSGIGANICNFNCAAPTCADDVAILCDSPQDLQIIINMAYNYSCTQRYKLQPTKSVILPIYPDRKKKREESFVWTIGDSRMPVVGKATHVGILRTSIPNDPDSIYENIQKAKRAIYSLLPAGFHGKNGLDIQSLIQILNIYVMPVLLYGLELLTPTGKNLEIMDIFHKKCLKQLLSLPMNVATPVIYLLTGHLPIEGQIDKKVLIFFGNMTRQSQDNLERQIVYRQSSVKSVDSNSWVVRIRQLLLKYRLPSIFELLDQPFSKVAWKKLIDNSVNTYWKESIEKRYFTLSITKFNYEKLHSRENSPYCKSHIKLYT